MATLQEVLTHLTGHSGGTPNRLHWADFTPVQHSPEPPAQARTFARIQSSYRIPGQPDRDGKYRLSRVSVTVSMDRNNSFVEIGTQSNALLNHEQGHFNITWIVARNLCRRLLEIEWDATLIDSLRQPAGGNPTAPVTTQAHEYDVAAGAESSSLNALYDDPIRGAKDANGVIVPAAQATWDQMINYAVVNDTNLPILVSMLSSVNQSPRQWPMP